MSKINNKRKTQKEKKIRKENNNQKVGGQRKEIINENKATDFYYLTVLYLEFQLVRTPPLSRMYGALTPRMYGSISKTVVKERGEKELWANTQCKSSVVKKWKTHDWLTTKKRTLIEVRSVLSSVTLTA